MPRCHALLGRGCLRFPHAHRMVVCRYAETVIYRIFYALDRCGTAMLSLRELKRCVLGLSILVLYDSLASLRSPLMS